MENKSEKSGVLLLIGGCLAAILIFHFAWATYLFQNWNTNTLFTIVDAVLAILFGGSSIIAYKNADDPNYDYWHRILIGIAVASSIWAAAWSTGLMNNISQGI